MIRMLQKMGGIKRVVLKKRLLALVCLCPLSFGLSCPDTSGGINPAPPKVERDKKVLVKEQSKIKEAPPSRTHRQVRIDESVTYRLEPISPNTTPQGKGRPLQVGITRRLSLDPLAKSKWFNLERGGQVGIFGIISAGALQLRVHFVKVDLPRGAKIFISSMKNPDEYYGPFEGRGPSNDGTFWTPPVAGEGVIIEYFIPGRSSRSKNSPSPFMVSEVSHVFR
jgi:hypothetical protein